MRWWPGLPVRAWRLVSVTALAAVVGASCGRRQMPGAVDGGAAGVTSGGGGTGGATTGGTGGGGAVGMTAGGGGSGGTALACGPMTRPNNSPACGAELCGNGMRDSCVGSGGIDGYPGGGGGIGGAANGGHGGVGIIFSEECDGADFFRPSCQAFGYASGTLSCNANCTFDLSGCEQCVGSQPSLPFCGRPSIAAFNLGFLALAATPTEIGLAWAGIDAVGVNGLYFTRLTPDLSLVSSFLVEPSVALYGELSVAPLPSGWVIAASEVNSLTLYPIAADGRSVGKTTIPKQSSPPQKPLLAARPGAGPVVVWMDDALRAAVVAADGLSITPSIVLPFGGPPNQHEVDAAFVGGAVHVVSPVDMGNVRPLQIVRILPDGSGASLVGGPSGTFLRLPALVAGAPNLDMVFSSRELGIDKLIWQRFDGAGSAVGPSAELGSFHNLQIVASVASGDNAAVLVPEEVDAITLMKLTLMGVQGASPQPGFTFAHMADHTPRLARRGSELIAAWVGSGGGCTSSRISIARLTP